MNLGEIMAIHDANPLLSPWWKLPQTQGRRQLGSSHFRGQDRGIYGFLSLGVLWVFDDDPIFSMAFMFFFLIT